MSELKKCGDLLFRRNQYWEWVSSVNNSKNTEMLSYVLNIPVDYIEIDETQNQSGISINLKEDTEFNFSIPSLGHKVVKG